MFYLISPHIDDAVLSLGGFLVTHARERNVQVLNVFSISQWTNPSSPSYNNALTKAHVTKMRKDEEKVVSQEIGYQSHYLDFEDLLLRDTSSNQNIKQSVRTALLRIVSIHDLLIFPLGLLHPDHILIREIGVDLMGEGHRIIFFEDQPYVSTPNGYEQKTALTIAVNLEPIIVAIDLQRKIPLMKAYKSQLSDEWINMIVDYTLNQGLDFPIERLWKPVNSDYSLSMLT